MQHDGWLRAAATFAVLGLLFGLVHFVAWGLRADPNVVAVWICLGLITSTMVGMWFE